MGTNCLFSQNRSASLPDMPECNQWIFSMIPTKSYFLQSYVAAVVELSNDNPETELELAQIFKAVGKSRPDLTERWRFAERGKSTVELEKLLDEALNEAKTSYRFRKAPEGHRGPVSGPSQNKPLNRQVASRVWEQIGHHLRIAPDIAGRVTDVRNGPETVVAVRPSRVDAHQILPC